MNPAYKMPGIRANVAPYAALTKPRKPGSRVGHAILLRGKGNRAARRMAAQAYQVEPGRFTHTWLTNSTYAQRIAAEAFLRSVARAYRKRISQETPTQP